MGREGYESERNVYQMRDRKRKRRDEEEDKRRQKKGPNSPLEWFFFVIALVLCAPLLILYLWLA